MSPEVTPTVPTLARGEHKRVIGLVVSAKVQKTRVVETIEFYKDPTYKKYVRRRKRFHCHDERNESHEGDRVMIIECRPLSRLKRWRLVKVLQQQAD